MTISPIYCPDTSCPWAAFGIPDAYTEARAYRLAAHRAEEHGEPLTADQVAYATRVGQVIPGTARTTAAAVAVLGALPMPVGDQPRDVLDDERLAEIDARAAHLYECVPMPSEADQLAGEDVPALLAEVQRLGEQVARLEDDKVRRLDQQAKDDAEYAQTLLERDRYRSAWQSARFRAEARGEGILRITRDRETYQGWLEQEQTATQQLRARIAELEEARRLEWLVQGTTPHTPRLCACGHSHHAHRVPAPHSCFAFGQTCPCEAYRQLPHAEAVAQLERNRRAAAETGGAS